MYYGAEVFEELKEEREFEGNFLKFDKEELSLSIVFGEGDKSIYESLLSIYGAYDSSEYYGINYDIFFMKKKLNSIWDLNTNTIKKGDDIVIKYKKEAPFTLYSYVIIFKVSDDRDDEYGFRKELERWSL